MANSELWWGVYGPSGKLLFVGSTRRPKCLMVPGDTQVRVRVTVLPTKKRKARSKHAK